MPIKKSAIKALRQSKKKLARNLKAKTAIRDLVKKSQKFILKQEKDSAVQKIKAAVKAIDKAMQQKIIKKNTGARKKSRLMKKLSKMLK
ncbi:MAG: 30S ribosomal protein S20 [Patescibacteria group bacterium]